MNEAPIDKLLIQLKHSAHPVITIGKDEFTGKEFRLFSVQLEETALQELIAFLEEFKKLRDSGELARMLTKAKEPELFQPRVTGDTGGDW